MELLLLQFYGTLVHFRVSELRKEGLPAMQPEDALIEGMGLDGSEIWNQCSQRPEKSEPDLRPDPVIWVSHISHTSGYSSLTRSALRVLVMTKQQHTYEAYSAR